MGHPGKQEHHRQDDEAPHRRELLVLASFKREVGTEDTDQDRRRFLEADRQVRQAAFLDRFDCPQLLVIAKHQADTPQKQVWQVEAHQEE